MADYIVDHIHDKICSITDSQCEQDNCDTCPVKERFEEDMIEAQFDPDYM